MKKTILLLFLTVMSTIGFVAGAADIEFDVGSLHYKVVDGSNNATVTGVSNDGVSATSLFIPGKITNPDNSTTYRVMSIGYQAFRNNTKITKVSIEWGVSYIMSYAFNGCSNLTEVHIPSSTTTMYQYIFLGCTKLQDVYFSSLHPTAINNNNFPSNSNMTLHIPKGCDKNVSEYKQLTGFTMFSSVVTDNICYDIPIYYSNDRWFYGCIDEQDQLDYSAYSSTRRSMVITGVNGSTTDFRPTNGTYDSYLRFRIIRIADDCTAGNTAITNIDLSAVSDLTDIGERAFKNCTNVTKAVVRCTNSIGYQAFYGCSKLTDFTIMNGVKELGSSMIAYTPLTRLTFPASVTKFNYAADYAKNLISIVADAENANYTSYYGTLYSKDYKRLVRQPEGRSLVAFPDNATLTTIDGWAFQGCSKLQEKVEIPYGVTSIGFYAFGAATGLKTLVIPSSVTSCSGNFVSGCSNLTDLYINLDTPPGTVTSMSFLFGSNYATIVPNVNLHVPYMKGGNYQSAGWDGFKACNPDNLQSYDFHRSLDGYGEAYYSVIQNASDNYTDEDGNTAAVDGYVKLLYGSESNITGSFKIPTTVTYYGKNYGVKQIGEYALRGTVEHSITGGWLVSAINEYAAYSDFYLTSVDLPNIETIGTRAFNAGSSNRLSKFNFGKGKLTSIGERAFIYANLPGTVALPYGLKTIDPYAFWNCNKIERLIIPSSVTTIGNHVAGACYGMKELDLNIPFSKLPENFQHAGIDDDGKVLVPTGNVEQYKTIFTSNTVEAGAYDFVYSTYYDVNYYHMTVISNASGTYTDPETEEETSFDGWATYVYHPNIHKATGFDFDIVETDRVTGKQYLMVALGDSVFADTPNLEEINFNGSTSTILSIGANAFNGCAVTHPLSFDVVLNIGELAFANMANCPEVDILTPSSLYPVSAFEYAIFDHNADNFKFYVDNTHFATIYDDAMDWDMYDGEYASQLRPFIRATHEIEPVSCYLNSVDYIGLGLDAYLVTDYDIDKKVLKTTKLDDRTVNYCELGVILTGLTPGEIYKLEPYEGDKDDDSGWNFYLTENWKQWVMTRDSAKHSWYWDASSQTFKRPKTSYTVPGGSAVLYIGDNDAALDVEEWTVEFESINPLDVNGDGKVNAADANVVIAEILAHPDGDGNKKYDVNNDDKVNAADANVIIAYILAHPDE